MARCSSVGREAAAGGAASIATPALEPGSQEDASSAIEEWLMELELPQPLKPVLGSRAWSSFTAAIVQMALVAFLAGLATFLEQGGPPEFYATNYPAFSGIILTLGFDHMYSSFFFLGLIAWLAASIIACTGTTQIPLARKAQTMAFAKTDSMRRRGTFLMKMDCCPMPSAVAASLAGGTTDSSASSGGDEVAAIRQESSQRLESLRGALQRRGFVVRADDDANPTRLAAQRGLVGKFAPMVVHVALILCLAGSTAGLLFGASSEVMLGDGGEAEMGTVLQRGRRAKGPLYEALNPFKGLMSTTTLKVEDFRIEYRPNGAVEQFYTKLALEDTRSKEQLTSDEIFVNKPLRYGGATVYQADWGIDRLQLYIRGVPVVVPLKALPDRDQNDRAWGAFVPKQILDAPLSAKTIKRSNDGIVLVVENMRNVQVYDTSRKLAGILRAPNAPVDQKMEGMPVQFGESIEVDGANLRIDRIIGATGLIVKSDPGVPLVYLGFGLLMPATLLSVLPFGQVWAAVSDKSPNQVLISGRSNRNRPAFEDEMKAMVLAAAK